MALLDEDTVDRKTMNQFKAWPSHKNLKQSNNKLPESLLKSLDAMAYELGETKQDLIALALYDFVNANGYLDKKITVS